LQWVGCRNRDGSVKLGSVLATFPAKLLAMASARSLPEFKRAPGVRVSCDQSEVGICDGTSDISCTSSCHGSTIGICCVSRNDICTSANGSDVAMFKGSSEDGSYHGSEEEIAMALLRLLK